MTLPESSADRTRRLARARQQARRERRRLQERQNQAERERQRQAEQERQNEAEFLRRVELERDEMLLKTNHPIVLIEAENTGNARNMSGDHLMGLQCKLSLSVDAKVVITSNIAQSLGLVNGTVGVVKDIVYADSARTSGQPDCVWVRILATGTEVRPSSPRTTKGGEVGYRSFQLSREHGP